MISVRALAAAAACITAMAANGQTAQVPAAVQPPPGQRAAMTWTGTGELTYECRAKAEAAAGHEWAFVAPDARLTDARSGSAMGRYFAGPTWEAADGSRITGKQVATAAAPAGNIPLQLVKTEAGSGAFKAITFIQRVNTRGGVAPADPCTAQVVGVRRTVPYSADYVFYEGS